MKGRWLLFLLFLMLVAVVIYWPAVSGPFLHWDDQIYITDSSLVTECSLASVGRAFTSFHYTDYAPLNAIALSLEYALMGPSPFAFHLFTIVFHAINAMFVFLILGRLLRDQWLAVLAAVLFLAHPLQVEAVAWIAEHKLVLCGVFFFGAILVQVRGGPRWAVLVLGIAAMLVKSSAVVLPPILVAYDRLVLRKRWREAILDQVPLGLAAVFAAVMNMLSQGEKGVIQALHGGMGAHAFGMLSLPGRYIAKLLFPVRLCAVYKDIDIAGVAQIIFVLATCVLGLLGIEAVRRRRLTIVFAFWWWFVAWIPVSNIVPLTTWMADRYMYLPMPGLLLAVTLWCSEKTIWQRRRREVLVAGLGVAAVFAVLSYQRAVLWRSERVFWEEVAACAPNTLACTHLSLSLLEEQRVAEARASALRALSLDPFFPNAYIALGRSLFHEGRRQEASASFLVAAMLDPASPGNWNNVVASLGGQTIGHYVEILQWLAKEASGAFFQEQLLRAVARRDAIAAESMRALLQETLSAK